VVLSGQIQKTDKGWETEEGEGPGDPVGPTYTKFRVAAGAYVAQEYPDATLIASGFAFFSDGPSIASVVKKELTMLGVSEDRIKIQDTPTKTYQELQLLAELHRDGYQRCVIVTNEWHVPRVEAMLANWPVFGAHVVAAEEVLLRHDPVQWEKRIAHMRIDPRIAKRIELEKQGVADIAAGRYRYH
jgi:hypothetical protein